MTKREEKWREKANKRVQWRKITKVAVQRSDKWPASPHQKENERKNKWLPVFIPTSHYLNEKTLQTVNLMFVQECNNVRISHIFKADFESENFKLKTPPDIFYNSMGIYCLSSPCDWTVIYNLYFGTTESVIPKYRLQITFQNQYLIWGQAFMSISLSSTDQLLILWVTWQPALTATRDMNSARSTIVMWLPINAWPRRINSWLLKWENRSRNLALKANKVWKVTFNLYWYISVQSLFYEIIMKLMKRDENSCLHYSPLKIAKLDYIQ